MDTFFTTSSDLNLIYQKTGFTLADALKAQKLNPNDITNNAVIAATSSNKSAYNAW